MDDGKKYRDWAVTIWEEPDYEKLITSKKFKYFIIGKEICPDTGRLHYQSYFYLKNPCNFKGMKKIMGHTPHLKPRYSTPKQASEYCKKDKDFYEYGELPEQGKRKDLDEIKDDIMSGNSNIEDITINNPMAYHQYGRTLEKLQGYYYNRNLRNFKTKGIWIFGETGTGKTRALNWIEKYFKDVFYYRDNNGWWDGYSQQELVVFNEFRGCIKFSHLLDLIDFFKGAKVPIRGKQPIPFNSKCIVITSALPPDEVYKNLANNMDSIQQLYRRIKIFELPFEKDNMKNDIIEYINEPYEIADTCE